MHSSEVVISSTSCKPIYNDYIQLVLCDCLAQIPVFRKNLNNADIYCEIFFGIFLVQICGLLVVMVKRF